MFPLSDFFPAVNTKVADYGSSSSNSERWQQHHQQREGDKAGASESMLSLPPILQATDEVVPRESFTSLSRPSLCFTAPHWSHGVYLHLQRRWNTPSPPKNISHKNEKKKKKTESKNWGEINRHSQSSLFKRSFLKRIPLVLKDSSFCHRFCSHKNER